MGTRVYVGNVAFDATEGTSRALVATSGNAVGVRLVTDRNERSRSGSRGGHGGW